MLFHFQGPERHNSIILPLAMDETAYKSTFDLETHVNSFLQLTALVPEDVLASVTSELCRTLINAASHNSFGIRSGSEDMEEYMGYALYPEASYFNHSCTPNIAKERVDNVWEFYASRDIGVGEECCITYFGGDEEDMAVKVRRLRAREHWGFVCMCARCMQESQA
jgi:SET and MYND domain-containing protein